MYTHTYTHTQILVKKWYIASLSGRRDLKAESVAKDEEGHYAT